jgi:ABC-type multidrug transport system ATPase subunit
MGAPELVIEQLNFSVNEKRILAGIYLKAGGGLICGIAGLNGSGKTSVFRCLTNEYPALDFVFRLNGDYVPANRRSGLIGYMPQISCLPGDAKVHEAIAAFGKGARPLRSDLRIGEFLKRRCRSLSGGERRYLEFHLVMSQARPIILLDEPFAQIEPLYHAGMIRKMRELRDHCCLIITDQDHRTLREACDELSILSSGRLIRAGKEDPSLERGGYLPRRI